MKNLKTSLNNSNNDRFRVLTYNLWCHRLVGGRNAAQRLRTFASWLLDESTQAYDIICLQEVFVCNPLLLLHYGSDQRANLIKAVESKYPFSCTANIPWSAVQDSGCLILSAHPLEPCHQESFVGYNLSQLATHKGFMCCKMTIANRELIVVNTHLHADMSTSTTIRERQLKQINDHITMYHANHRVIVCGDLNIEYGSKEYRGMFESLTSHRLTDATPKAAATYLRLVRLDYILINEYFSSIGSNVVSADDANQNNLQRMISDHEGLECTLRFINTEPAHVPNTKFSRSFNSRSPQIRVSTILLITVITIIISFTLVSLALHQS